MRELYKWYFPLDEKDISSIWEEGVLTLDTNVLLDLYRYHENTRKALLRSLKDFNGRIWICGQVAEEFFRNRKQVIVTSGSGYNDAERCIADIQKTCETSILKLKNNRIMPDEFSDRLNKAIDGVLSDSRQRIEDSRNEHPNYLEEDPILDDICDLFAGEVGSTFEVNELSIALKEAKRRQDNNIPPGYKDSSKEGDKPYGDYLMWRQMLDYAKEKNVKMVFVTSEQKEDWWEKVSGKTIGPRYELIKEFYQETNQPILFYRTDRFLEFALNRAGDQTSTEAVKEIREIAKQRHKSPLAVQIISQEEELADSSWSCGTLRVNLLRPAFNFTCSGHFEPKMSDVPDLEVDLIEAPNNTPSHIIRSGTGTTFDFNIHIKSNESGKSLPTGEYVFSYDALAYDYVIEDIEDIEDSDEI